MYKKYLKKFVALSVCLLLGLSMTDVGFSSWETLVGSSGGSVSADIGTGAEVVVTGARLVLDGNAGLASGDISETEDSDLSDEADTEPDAAAEEGAVEEYDSEESPAGAAEEAESSDGTSGDAEVSDDGEGGHGETDSAADETRDDDASDGENNADEDETSDSAADETVEDDASDGENSADEDKTSDSGTATDGDEEVSSDSGTSSQARVTAIGWIHTGTSAESDAEDAENTESAENEAGSSGGTVVVLDADEIAGTAPDFPGVILPDAESAVTYSITVENQGRYDAVVGDMTLPDGLEDFEVDGPEIEEGRVLEPGESLELVWTVCLADGGAAEIDFSVEIDFDLPDAGEAPEACYAVIKAGEEEKE